MKRVPRRRCPVCWQAVMETVGGMVYQHWDSIGRDICPMSGTPFEYAASPPLDLRFAW